MENIEAEPDADFYYDSNGKKVTLERAPGYFCVRYVPGGRIDDPGLPAKEQRFLRDDSENIDFIPQYGLQLYRSRTRDDTALKSELMALNAASPIAYATPVFRRSQQPEDLVAVTNLFLIEFNPEISAAQAEASLARLLEKYGVKSIERLSYTAPSQGFLLQAPSGDGPGGPVSLAKTFYQELPLRYAIPDLVQRRGVRHCIGDTKNRAEERQAIVQRGAPVSSWTYQNEQWHLSAANIPDVWAEHTLGDPSIVIAISDDGVDIEHQEFGGKLTEQFDFALGIPNGMPKSAINNHGTACAGVALARGVHARGAAPNCSLMAVRFPNYLGVADEARMFEWMANNGADIINCSWGPPDGTGAVYPLPDNVASAIRYCVTSGRKGKGIPIVWAAGNGNELVSHDGYAANPYVIAVAACNERDLRSHYSDFGPEIAICAPSSGDASSGDRRIFTTDRSGSEGYNSGGGTTDGDNDGYYTNDFGGTSSAAPLVAGIAGLMLSVNPELTWRQVKQTLMNTADKIADGYDSAGHNDYYGHGRVNAYAAVSAARTREPVSANIEGPSSLSPNDPPPRFQITLPPDRYYAIEVATESRLFRMGVDAASRASNNFFASWQESGFLTIPEYQLPSAVWETLRTAKRLFYRIWINSSAYSWHDFYATTPSDRSQDAPFIELRGNEPGISASITTAASHPRDGGPPIFDIDMPAHFFYAVELATNYQLFGNGSHLGERNATNFFATWEDSRFLSSSQYKPPISAWNRLKAAERIFYRMWISADDNAWENFFATTPSNNAQNAPYLRVIGDQQDETVKGPTVYPRAVSPPEFEIGLPQNRYFAVEVATQARLFDAASNANLRTPCNFFASWSNSGLISGSSYALPEQVWDRLKQAERLYYRLWTSGSDQIWESPRVTTAGNAFISSPFILIKDLL